MIAFLVVLFLAWLVVHFLRRRGKRALVAGLDKPAVWREPAPGRLTSRRCERL